MPSLQKIFKNAAGGLVTLFKDGTSYQIPIQELIDSGTGSAVALSSGTVANAHSLVLPAATYDIFGVVGYNSSGAGVADLIQSSLSTTSATADTTMPRFNSFSAPAGASALDLGRTSTFQNVGPARFVFAVQTTIYLTARVILVSGTGQATGRIIARKVSNVTA